MKQRKDMLYIFIVLLLFGQSLPVPMYNAPVCDDSRAVFTQEGNIGESENFPWLGILRVHLHEFDQLKIAVTGLVLVKDNFAIANADDIHRIPKYVFTQDSKAMFIPKRGEPWFTKPKDYMIHPEFEYSTYNTIALVELELQEGGTKLPFKPVCWPGNFFNTSNQLFALGYTDENKLMEKTMYSIQYVKPSLCKEFYNRVGFSDPNLEPTHIQCGFAENNKKDCTWENGMALVSNSSGKWTLIGLGIRGPGCSAPARFLDMSVYLPWVESATDLEEINDYPDFRRKTAFNVGFRRTDETPKTRPAFREPYPDIDINSPPAFKIYELKPGHSHFWELPMNTDQAGLLSGDQCTTPKSLVYREQMSLVDTYETGGNLEYRVTLYDRFILSYTCIKVQIKNAVSRFPVRVWFNKRIDILEGTGFEGPIGDTPLEIIKYLPRPPKRTPPTTTPKPKKKDTTEPTAWMLGEHLEAKYISDKANHSGFETINIIIGFEFTGNATMDLYIYGIPHPTFRTRTTTEEPPPMPFEWRRKFPRDRERKRHSHKFPRMKRKNRLEEARERAADRKARRREIRV